MPGCWGPKRSAARGRVEGRRLCLWPPGLLSGSWLWRGARCQGSPPPQGACRPLVCARGWGRCRGRFQGELAAPTLGLVRGRMRVLALDPDSSSRMANGISLEQGGRAASQPGHLQGGLPGSPPWRPLFKHHPRDALLLPFRDASLPWARSVPSPAPWGEKVSSSGPPRAGGRQRPMLGARGRPCPAEPTRARPAAAGLPEPGRGAGAAGEGRSRARRRDPARSLGPRVVSGAQRRLAVAPFPELGLSPKAAIGTSETRRRGIFRDGGCVRPRHKGLFSTPPLPSRSLPAGSRRGSHRGGAALAAVPGGGVAAGVAPEDTAVAPRTRTLWAPFVNGG